MQTNIECQICYQWTNEDDFLQMCYNPAHILCQNCAGQVIDQGICPYCRQINPNYTEPFSSSSEEESLNVQFEQSSSESYQPLDEQHSQWVLDNITDTTLITHFIVHNQDRQQILDIIRLLQIMLRHNFVNTRSIALVANQNNEQQNQDNN